MDFKKKYDRTASLDFLKNQFLPDDFNSFSQEIDIEFKNQFIKKVTLLGNVDSLGLKVYEVEHISEHDPRVNLSRETFKFMANYGVRRALVFFISSKSENYRFSLINIDLKLEGKKITKEYSNPKRYSFYLGPDAKTHTPEDFLIKKGRVKDFEDLFSRFNVEVVTKKFFEEFRYYFEKTKQEFKKSNENTICLWLKDKYSDSDEEYKEQINKFVYTFLGRIIFIYFLERKGWIENETNYLEKFIENKNNSLLYLNFFQPLFFDVFAKKEKNRPIEIKKQYKDTPYLNGGLFERSEIENQLEKSQKFILFEDDFIREIILNFFEKYNFTVDENSPNDQEVSIDPEMLGKVFENTLAEEEKGKKGTFYTPREIVHFMVKDSLFRFLQNETNIDKSKIHQIIYSTEEEKIDLPKDKIRLIDNKLEHIKVFDPAVGSAAFPVEMMQVLVDLRKRLNVNVGQNVNEVFLKKQFIKKNLYGVDIDPGAIEISKLRLWLSLIVDYKRSELEAEPLPNLDFQFRLGNSLQEKIDDIDIFQENVLEQTGLFKNETTYEKVKERMISIKDKFYNINDEVEKRKLKKEFDNFEHKLIQSVLDKYDDQFGSQIKNLNTLVDGHKNIRTEKEITKILKKISNLEQKIKDGTYKLFKPDFHFSEVFDRKDANGNKIGGFDIVIGNPPYGVKIEDDIKKWHKLGSKDSYGIFISTALKRFLKPGGVLSYIISDTWLTIKTHKQLRQQVLEKQLHKIIRLHKDCFDATVNACIMSLTNRLNNNNIIVADLTNISTRKEGEELREKLYYLEKFIGQSTPKFAVYEYDQDLIKINSNLPIFVGSPKLFCLMNDTTCKTLEKEIGDKEKKKVKVRQIKFNGKIIDLVRFGDIAEIRQGLATGDNYSYLFQNPEAHGSYRSINDYQEFLLTEDDLIKISGNEQLRTKVIEKGIHKSRTKKSFDSNLWFGGRYIAPYNKGGGSDTESGWLPNYYVPTDYFIDWSRDTIRRMQTLTIGERDGTNRDQVAAVFRKTDFYFRDGITFSFRGIYSPTFRLSGKGVFDCNGSSIFSFFSVLELLGILNSKLCKYYFKNFVEHTIASDVDALKEIVLRISNLGETGKLVSRVINNQKQTPRYDYMSNEQKRIDKLVYKMYGLNKKDIREVETWYARRYPKLARFCDIN